MKLARELCVICHTSLLAAPDRDFAVIPMAARNVNDPAYMSPHVKPFDCGLCRAIIPKTRFHTCNAWPGTRDEDARAEMGFCLLSADRWVRLYDQTRPQTFFRRGREEGNLGVTAKKNIVISKQPRR